MVGVCGVRKQTKAGIKVRPCHARLIIHAKRSAETEKHRTFRHRGMLEDIHGRNMIARVNAGSSCLRDKVWILGT